MIIILTIYFQIYEKERVLVSKRSISFTRNFVAAQEFAPEWPVRLQAQSEVLQQWGTRHPASASSLNFHQYKELKLEKDLEPKQTRRITKEKDQSSGIRIEEKDRLTPTHLKIVKDKNLNIAIAHRFVHWIVKHVTKIAIPRIATKIERLSPIIAWPIAILKIRIDIITSLNP